MPHHKIQLLYYLQVSCNKIHTTFNIFYREKDRGREKFELTTLLALCMKSDSKFPIDYAIPN